MDRRISTSLDGLNDRILTLLDINEQWMNPLIKIGHFNGIVLMFETLQRIKGVVHWKLRWY